VPEGDTIHTVRRLLAPHLLSVPLIAVQIDRRLVPEARGARVDRCDAVGKHLLLRLALVTGAHLTLRVHLGMHGSWHAYRPHEAWQRHPDRARLVLATPTRVFVCFDAKDIGADDSRRTRVHAPTSVAHLGPDLLASTTTLGPVIARAREPRHAGMALGDLLLHQPLACGIGNVYKNEGLFLEGLDPWTPTSRIDDDTLLRLFERITALMHENLAAGGWRITTWHAGDGLAARGRPKSLRHWVYRRAARPCRRCGSAIRSRLQGPLARMTYWCPTCQPAAHAGPPLRPDPRIFNR
jgi:endonuclease-8